MAGLLGPKSGFLQLLAGLCTVQGVGPSPHVPDWPGNRCELLLPPSQAALTEKEKEKHRKKEMSVNPNNSAL